MLKAIAQNWPDDMPDKLPMVLPPWNDEAAWKAWQDAQPASKPA